jgi:hypothetical protein
MEIRTMPRSKSVPAYKLHKTTGQARVIIDGRRHYLGEFGSDKSKEKYARLLAEYAVAPIASATDLPETTVKELVASYWMFAEGYYQKNGKLSGHLAVVRQGLRAIKQLYATLPVQEFGPLKLEAVQQYLIGTGNSRTYINGVVSVIRRMFKWAESKELVPRNTYHTLATLPGLKKVGPRQEEPAPIGPVSAQYVDAMLPYLPTIVADMAMECDPSLPYFEEYEYKTLAELVNCTFGELLFTRHVVPGVEQRRVFFASSRRLLHDAIIRFVDTRGARLYNDLHAMADGRRHPTASRYDRRV